MEPSGECFTRYLVHNMINYFSIGADAAIVFAFEKCRKKTTIGNKAMYASQGIKQHIPGFRPRHLKSSLNRWNLLRGRPVEIPRVA